MSNTRQRLVGVDLFAGAGGMSLGAKMAGIDVLFAVENDKNAVATYACNHPETQLFIDDIRNLKQIDLQCGGRGKVLFGGPPCQGFSTSNQRTRHKDNPSNWLFQEFIRIAALWVPDWIVFENVRGIIETDQGLFRQSIIQGLQELGYTCSDAVLCATNFGVPQVRYRFFLVGSRHGISVEMPKPTIRNSVTVIQAIGDLPSLENGANKNHLSYPFMVQSDYAKEMRNGHIGCSGHLVSKNSSIVIDRYKFIPQGGNWENIPGSMMNSYSDRTRCHTGIYRRLRADHPSVVIGNYRKNMLIHPFEDRGLSVREAARLQSFPDWYEFKGSIGFQQQQVGNAVPPLLAKAVFLGLS